MLHHVNSESLRPCISTTLHIWNAKPSFLATLQIFCVINCGIFSSQPSINFNSFILFWFFTDTGNQCHESKASIKPWKIHKKLHWLLSITTSSIKLHYRLLEIILNFKVTEHHFPRIIILKTQTLHKRTTVQNPFLCRYLTTISQHVYTSFYQHKNLVTHCLKTDANQALSLSNNGARQALLPVWILLQNS